MNSKPSICFVAPNIYPVLARDRNVKMVGGAEVQQSILARAFAATGHRVTVVCMDVGQPEGVEVDRVTVHNTYRPKSGLPILRFFHPHISLTWRALARADADIYYQRGCGMLTGIVAAFCRLHRKQFVFAGAHDQDFDSELPKLKKKHDKFLFRWGIRQADAVVVQNSQQLQMASASGFTPFFVGSCYQQPPNASLSRQGYVLWVARFCSWKQPEIFIELARRLPQFHFRMVGGSGSEAGEAAFFETMKRQAANVANLEFVGFVPHAEVEREFDGARVFVNTSEAEGFPNTFLQTWARGIPTVSFVQPAFDKDGKSIGRTVQNVDALIQEVNELMGDDRVWHQEGERCRQYFEAHHSVQQAFDAYAALFGQLTEGRKQ